jgi:hypothetical protein
VHGACVLWHVWTGASACMCLSADVVMLPALAAMVLVVLKVCVLVHAAACRVASCLAGNCEQSKPGGASNGC